MKLSKTLKRHSSETCDNGFRSKSIASGFTAYFCSTFAGVDLQITDGLVLSLSIDEAERMRSRLTSILADKKEAAWKKEHDAEIDATVRAYLTLAADTLQPCPLLLRDWQSLSRFASLPDECLKLAQDTVRARISAKLSQPGYEAVKLRVTSRTQETVQS